MALFGDDAVPSQINDKLRVSMKEKCFPPTNHISKKGLSLMNTFAPAGWIRGQRRSRITSVGTVYCNISVMVLLQNLLDLLTNLLPSAS